MHTVNLLIRLVEHHQLLTYAIIFLGVIFEGEIFVISVGVLLHLGALNLYTTIIIVLIAAFAKPFLGYALGEFLSVKFKNHKILNYIKKRVYILLPRFKKRPFWSIFISKFIWGANNIVIIFSGYEKIDYKKFFKAEALSILVWAPIMLSLGYVFSFTALNVSREVWRFLLVVIVLLAIYVIFDKLVSWVYELFEEYYNEQQ